jgi:CRP-like cAMP-binding protein
LAKFTSLEHLCKESAKRNFICIALDINYDFDGSVLKSLVRKFSSKMYSKDSIIVQEGEKQENFMLIRNGTVRLLKSVFRDKRSQSIKTAIISEGSFLNDL